MVPSPLSRWSSENLVRAATEGRKEAFDELVLRHRSQLYYMALPILKNSEDAQDAVQDAFLSAYQNLKSFRLDSKFRTWVIRILINAALMRRRSRKTVRKHVDDTVSFEETRGPDITGDEMTFGETIKDTTWGSPEERVRELELREALSQSLDQLSPILRVAFITREFEGCSTTEAAKKLGLTENTLKARLWRAKRELAKKIPLRRAFGMLPREPLPL